MTKELTWQDVYQLSLHTNDSTYLWTTNGVMAMHLGIKDFTTL